MSIDRDANTIIKLRRSGIKYPVTVWLQSHAAPTELEHIISVFSIDMALLRS